MAKRLCQVDSLSAEVATANEKIAKYDAELSKRENKLREVAIDQKSFKEMTLEMGAKIVSSTSIQRKLTS